jgi:hypothetical protein
MHIDRQGWRMTKLLNKALEELEKLPADRQDEVAAMLLDLMARETGDFQLTPEQEAGIGEAIEQVKRGEFARPEDIDAIYARYGG